MSCASNKVVHKETIELTQAQREAQQLEQAKRISIRLRELTQSAKASGPEKVRFVAGDMYLKASAALMEKDYLTANLVFEQLVTLVPNDDFIKQKYAISLIRSSDYEKAETLLASIFKNSKEKDLKSGLVLAGIYSSLEKTNEARRVYSALLKAHPENEESCVFLGKSYANTGAIKKAVKFLKKCEKRNPNKGIYSYYMGKVFIDKKDYKAALKYFKRSLKAEPGFSQASLGLGLVYEELGNIKKAEKVYKKHIATRPSDTVVLSRLVQLMFAQKKFREVIGYAEMLSDYEPDNLNLKAKLAILYKDTQQYDKAVAGFKHLISIAPDNEDLYYYLGSIYQEMSSFEEALSSFAKIPPQSGLYQDSSLQIAQILSSLARQDASNYEERFLSFSEKKRDEITEFRVDFSLIRTTYFEAIGENQKAIKSLDLVKADENFGTDHNFYLASLYEKEKDYQSAKKVIELILDKEPKNAHAWNFLGYSLLEREIQLDKAFELISKAVALSPNDGYIRDSLGWYHFKQGNLVAAAKELERAIKEVPNDVAINKHMAIVYVAKKDFDKAKFFIGNAIKSSQNAKERESLVEVLKDLERNRVPASFQELK